jgi:hypothetical protein
MNKTEGKKRTMLTPRKSGKSRGELKLPLQVINDIHACADSILSKGGMHLIKPASSILCFLTMCTYVPVTASKIIVVRGTARACLIQMLL